VAKCVVEGQTLLLLVDLPCNAGDPTWPLATVEKQGDGIVLREITVRFRDPPEPGGPSVYIGRKLGEPLDPAQAKKKAGV